jgi:hypothetical protein
MRQRILWKFWMPGRVMSSRTDQAEKLGFLERTTVNVTYSGLSFVWHVEEFAHCREQNGAVAEIVFNVPEVR